jgi:hypothetical protein
MLQKNVETVVLMNGIRIDGTVSPVDYVYSIKDINLSKRMDVIKLLSSFEKEGEEENENEGEEENENEGEEENENEGEEENENEGEEENDDYENLPPKIISESMSINELILKRRESINPEESAEEEPQWLQEAVAKQKTEQIEVYKNNNNSSVKEDENEIVSNALESNTINSINAVDRITESKKSNTFVVSDSNIVLELKGVLLPSVICTLAPQRVIVPLENGNVVMISGTKKIVRIAQWTIDVESFDETTYTYTSTNNKSPNSSHRYDLRNSNIKTTKTKNVYLQRERTANRGSIKTLHSLKKLQYQRR